MSIPGTATRRPVAVAMLFLAILLLGAISYVRLPIDLLPDVSYPRLVIYTSYPDVAPAEIERLVSERVESEAAAVPGVERVTSVSREGVSLVTLRFAWGSDMDFAMLNVRERMDNLREVLPESATRPRILRVDPESEPIMAVSVTSGGDLWNTKELAETVFRRRLEQLDGVAQAAVSGGLDREIQVEVDPRLMEAYGLTLAQVAEALERANVSAPGGTIRQGRYRYPLRTIGEFQTVEEIGEVVLARQAQGGGAGAGGGGVEGESAFRLIRLRDVAAVVDGYAERETIAEYNGEEAVGLLVFKESGANTVGVARAVEEVLEQLRVEYPDVELVVATSQADFISEAISNVVSALVLGGILAFLVLFLFLRDSRYPFAIAAAIPISVVATFALMEAFDVSLNIMSLGGLALGVGMLVDNSIVVLENIFRHREAGLDSLRSAIRGAEEVQGAITASTLTTISVFGPIIYVEGVAGELFADLSLAVAFSLVASLLVALTLLPALSGRFGGGPGPAEEAPRPVRPAPAGILGRIGRGLSWIVLGPFRLVGFLARLARALVVFWAQAVGATVGRVARPFLDAFDRGFARFADRYHRALEWSLDHQFRVLGMAGLALAGTVLLGSFLPRDLLPTVDQGAFRVRLTLPEGTGLDATAEAAEALEAAILADPGVASLFGRVGRDVRAYAEGDEDTGLNTAVFDVLLRDRYPQDAPGGLRGPVTTPEVLGRLAGLSARFPEGALSLEAGQATALGTLLGGREADVAVRVRGERLDLLMTRAEEVRDRLEGLDVLTNVRVGAQEGTPQVQVEIDRIAAARYGIEPRVVAETVDRALRGDRATEFVDFDRKIDVVVSFPRDRRYSRETLEGLRVEGVPIRELVRIRDAEGPAEIRREEQGRMIPVYADVARGGLDAAIAAIEGALDDYPVTREVRMEVGGENEEMRRSFRDLGFAFALALVLVYMILAAQFESFLHPFTILMAVPLALVGAVLALFATGQGLNTMSLIGVVILVGIVVNDAIVKVDFINQARAAGRSLRSAILEAGRVRLRPIVMTTVTTVLGLTPMALGLGRGADLRAPLAIAVIGGLSVATLLTLVVVPVVYAATEGARMRWRGEVETLASGAAGAGREGGTGSGPRTQPSGAD